MKKAENNSRTRLQRFGLFFFNHVKTTASLWVALVIFGVLSYSVFMQRQGFPNISVPISVASGTYFVNDKDQVDREVVAPLDALITSRSSVKNVTSNAGANFFSVVIEHKDGADTKAEVEALKKAVQEDSRFPKSAVIEFRSIDAAKINNQYDVLLTVVSQPDSTTAQVLEKAERATNDLKNVTGVEKVTLINPYKDGTNPLTGESVRLQETFDRYGERKDGKTELYPSINIGIVAKAGTDAIHLEKAINERLAELNGSKEYESTTVILSSGVAESIEEQIGSLQQNLLEGLIVVILISLLLISFRAGVATALSMVSVLLITVGVLYVAGITLNTITLFALVLCLGLIVDDTTIMTEAIDAGKRSKASNKEIVALAIKKVARASTAGTLVTMLAFSPMLFINGILGSFIRVLPITIIVSLAVSLLVSLTLIPFMSRGLILTARSKRTKSRNPVLKLEHAISNGLASLIRIGTHNRKKAAAVGLVAIAVSVLLLGASTMYFKKLKFDIFPSTKDSDYLGLSINFPVGTDIEGAERITDEVNQKIASEFGENLHDITYASSGSSQSASATVRLVSFKEREVKAPELIEKATQSFEGFSSARVKVTQLDAGPPKEDLPFKVQIFGEDVSKTDALAKDIAAYLDGRDIARASNGTTSRIVRTETSGGVNGSAVVRKQAKRLVEVRAGFDSTDTSALVTAAQTAVEKEFTAEKLASYGVQAADVTFDFGSESSNQDSFKSMLLAFPVLLAVMFVLLAFQFRSLLQPLLIFMAIPFSFFGVATGLFYTDNPLSFFVMIGFFALIGIAVNNTILLTDYANQARKQGEGGFESMALAVKARFRPLVATSLTSVVALIPLALADPFWESLAFTLIFGLLSSTFLVVVSFPYYYLAIEFLRHRYSRRLTLAWLLAVIIAVVVVAQINSKRVGIVFVLAFGVMFTTWLKNQISHRLLRKSR